jgi:DNA end-binding protein Ku
MPAAAFQGQLRISLVSVPVKAFSASVAGSGQISFNQLHESCHRRIQYKKFCPIHGQVTADEIVSGYEYEKDKYVVVDAGEIEKLRTEKDRSVDIQSFVKLEQVDALYQSGKNYYLLPDGVAGQKPYQLIRQAMSAARVCGLAQVVISRREELVMIRPMDQLLVMTVLKYACEMRSPESFAGELVDAKGTKQEQELTAQLIKALTQKTFDLSDYHDKYEERLRELIEAKIEGKDIVAPPPTKAEPDVINLMDAIRKSMRRIKPAAAEKSPRKSTHRAMPAAARRRKSG